MIVRSLAVLAAALAFGYASVGVLRASADAAPSGRILFVRGGDLFVTSADGRDVRRLVRNAEQPAVTADGRRIAFVRDESIWVMGRDGSGQKRITSGTRDWTPAWSPDGRTIYFGREIEGKSASGGYEFAWPLYRMNADGSGVRQLTRPVASDHGECHESPSVAPNGRAIAYAIIDECDRGTPAGVFAIDPVGRRVELAGYDTRTAGFDPDWAPVGRAIAFATISDLYGEPDGIGIASPGSRARRVYRRTASDPAWSSDGRWIAFVRGGKRGQIWLVRRDGTGLRRLSNRRYDADPAWLPPPG